LRGAIRTIASALAHGGAALDQEVVAVLNRHAAGTPRWRELRTEPEPHPVLCARDGSVAAVLSAVAEEAVELFGGPLRHELRACQGPGCVLFFIRDKPRREWCSAGCGNRARAARHYARTREAHRSR
jgi:predicted RNA-binding Zn ribbon-like protein